MTIFGRFHPPNFQAFREHLSRCQETAEMVEAVRYSVGDPITAEMYCSQPQFMADEHPAFTATQGIDSKVRCPLPDECMLVLVKGSFQLDDENERFTKTKIGLQTEGSKTLTVESDSIVIWFPHVCCWDPLEFALARKGQCRRNLGVISPRDSSNPLWWEMERTRSRWPQNWFRR